MCVWHDLNDEIDKKQNLVGGGAAGGSETSANNNAACLEADRAFWASSTASAKGGREGDSSLWRTEWSSCCSSFFSSSGDETNPSNCLLSRVSYKDKVSFTRVRDNKVENFMMFEVWKMKTCWDDVLSSLEECERGGGLEDSSRGSCERTDAGKCRDREARWREFITGVAVCSWSITTAKRKNIRQSLRQELLSEGKHTQKHCEQSYVFVWIISRIVKKNKKKRHSDFK